MYVTTVQVELYCQTLYIYVISITNENYHILVTFKTWCKSSLKMAQ
jgi:hypothetical protein